MIFTKILLTEISIDTKISKYQSTCLSQLILADLPDLADFEFRKT